MLKTCAASLLLLVLPFALLAPLSLEAARPVFKCVINGSTTYQNDPCPTGESRAAPTVEQLNAERQKKLREAASAAATSASEKQGPVSAAAPDSPAVGSARCDGRVHCSQMTSCAEAKYFLSHCPGVKMDGDGNGIPCEKQWCNR